MQIEAVRPRMPPVAAENPYVLRLLMFQFFLDSLRADDFRPGLAGCIVRKLASVARRTAA